MSARQEGEGVGGPSGASGELCALRLQRHQRAPAAADAELALVALGFKQVEARKALKELLKENPQADTDELIRGALRRMTR